MGPPQYCGVMPIQPILKLKLHGSSLCEENNRISCFYNIYFGIAPDKLYNCIMVHDVNEYYFKGMDMKQTYYFSIESINENGLSKKTSVIKVD